MKKLFFLIFTVLLISCGPSLNVKETKNDGKIVYEMENNYLFRENNKELIIAYQLNLKKEGNNYFAFRYIDPDPLPEIGSGETFIIEINKEETIKLTGEGSEKYRGQWMGNNVETAYYPATLELIQKMINSEQDLFLTIIGQKSKMSMYFTSDNKKRFQAFLERYNK